MSRHQKGRRVNGILLLDKPIGMTSNEALQEVKTLFRARKAGHTGSLDPLAEGLLAICFGVATKISTFLLDADKRYKVTIRLGVTTTTGDAEGEVLAAKPVDMVSEQKVLDVLKKFRGEIQQLPPMHSALKYKGERLYKLARKGIEVKREPRTVSIYSLELIACELPKIELDVRCSKGTYIRTLAEDIGKALGCGGHVIALRRTSVGLYTTERSVTFETVREIEALGDENALDALLLPVDSALQSWPSLHLSSDSLYYLRMGQAVLVSGAPTQGWVRLYSSSDEFIGVGRVQDDGKVAPKRLMSES